MDWQRKHHFLKGWLMAHFAELDENNIVVRVVVVGNDDCKDEQGNENETVGIIFCNNLFGGVWKQTSYNGHLRKNYAGIAYTYDPILDAFIAPKPFTSWSLNTSTAQWEPPVSIPNDGQTYIWDESTTSWVVVS